MPASAPIANAASVQAASATPRRSKMVGYERAIVVSRAEERLDVPGDEHAERSGREP